MKDEGVINAQTGDHFYCWNVLHRSRKMIIVVQGDKKILRLNDR
jgi:hypothetical protein